MNPTIERLSDVEYEKAVATRVDEFMRDCAGLKVTDLIPDIFYRDMVEVIGLYTLHSDDHAIEKFGLVMLAMGAWLNFKGELQLPSELPVKQ